MSSKVFSILIPSWNNLKLLQLCLKAIETHSKYAHEILIHINEGKDGTEAWVKSKGYKYTVSKENIGICHALNGLAKLASTSYIVYLNDDMYVCPLWDVPLWNEIEGLSHKQFFLSATMIEPRETGNKCAIAPYNFGTSLESFKEAELLKKFTTMPFKDWSGSMWPPNVVHKDLWDKVGGYSIEFSPGMYSDPDFAMKLWQNGVRYFKGVSDSRVYHFMSKSTGKVVRNNGRKQFFQKWRLSASTFTRRTLNLGLPFNGKLTTTVKPGFKDLIKRLIY